MRLRSSLRLILIVLVPIFLVACSRTPAIHSPAGAKIRLAYATIPQAGIVQIALAKGFFKNEGLNVIPQSFAFGKPALESVINGESDLATVAETPFIYALLGGANLSISAVIETSDKTTALVVNRTAGIEKTEDLAGKTIGVTKGTSGEYFLNVFLMARGLDTDKITIVDMLPENMLATIKAGNIDAAAIWNPVLLGISEELGADGTVFFGDDVYTEHFCLAGMQDFAWENPDAMRSFMKALIRAEIFLRENKDTASKIIAEYSKTEESDLKSILSLLRFRVSIDQTLPLLLEDEIRWAMKGRTNGTRGLRDYTEYIVADALSAVSPDRVRLIR